MIQNFQHIQAAHCENGVTTNLLAFNGLDFITEPLSFGLGCGIFYIHVPFLKVNNGPFLSFRTLPGSIFKKTCKSLGVGVKRKKFRNQQDAQVFLDKKINEGVPVGCQVGVFHLPYFPREYRFHFNAHNLIVYGKQENNYLISDPVMETTTSLTVAELDKVRFAKGALAPKGQIYFPENVNPANKPEILKRMPQSLAKAIKTSSRDMVKIPSRLLGVRGIKYTAGQVRKWRNKMGPKAAGLYLGQIVRMQEEIGTGGGGFRFLYAAFLEEAYNYIPNDALLKVSEQFTKAGDMWRSSAVQMAGIYKGRITSQKDFDDSANLMLEVAEIEKQAFQQLYKLKLA